MIRSHQPVARREVARMLGVKATTASVHLQALKRHGLASGSSRGRDSVWSLTPPPAANAAPAAGVVNDIWSFAAAHRDAK